MLKVQGERGSACQGAAVLLLDWFILDKELILVQERPVPSTDLLHYMKTKGGLLEEQEAKVSGGRLDVGSVQLSCSLEGGRWFTYTLLIHHDGNRIITCKQQME